jgi:hypothetical protein
MHLKQSVLLKKVKQFDFSNFHFDCIVHLEGLHGCFGSHKTWVVPCEHQAVGITSYTPPIKPAPWLSYVAILEARPSRPWHHDSLSDPAKGIGPYSRAQNPSMFKDKPRDAAEKANLTSRSTKGGWMLKARTLSTLMPSAMLCSFKQSTMSLASIVDWNKAILSRHILSEA